MRQITPPLTSRPRTRRSTSGKNAKEKGYNGVSQPWPRKPNDRGRKRRLITPLGRMRWMTVWRDLSEKWITRRKKEGDSKVKAQKRMW